MKVKQYASQTSQRKARVRAKLRANTLRPRLSVFRSNKHTYAQIIDDSAGKVISGAHTGMFKADKSTKTDLATKLGEKIAELAKNNKITQLALDRGAHKYHGRVKAVAEAARKAGLKI